MRRVWRRWTAWFLTLLLALLTALPAAAEELKTEEPEMQVPETGKPDWDLSPLPEAWFDDAVFIGDSITVVLGQEAEARGGLGEALFLNEFSYGVRNAVSGVLLLWFRGQQYFPWDALPLTGAGKVFFMLGANDVAREGGLDKTMECWEELCTRIKTNCPDIQIFIQSELPVWHEIYYVGLNNDNLLVYNERLRSFCEERGYVYVNVADVFRDEYGGLAERYTSDYYCHITYEGARLWIETLRDPSVYSEDPRLYGQTA